MYMPIVACYGNSVAEKRICTEPRCLGRRCDREISLYRLQLPIETLQSRTRADSKIDLYQLQAPIETVLYQVGPATDSIEVQKAVGATVQSALAQIRYGLHCLSSPVLAAREPELDFLSSKQQAARVVLRTATAKAGYDQIIDRR